MSIYVDQKYANLLSPHLQNYKRKSQYLWNFRCPICGDSAKNKIKSRGYIFRRKVDLGFSCHNCGAGMAFGLFLKQISPALYRDYQLENFSGSKEDVEKVYSKLKSPKIDFSKVRIDLPSIKSLPDTHTAKRYILTRKIPEVYHEKLYYANDFKAFVDEMLPENDKDLIKNDPRIVIPFYDADNTLLGFQGRTNNNSSIKYITIKMCEENKKVFGLDKVDFHKTIYVVEGPFDSMFLTNSIAMMDAALYHAIPYVGNHDYVFVYDNENRNSDVIRHMKKTIALNKKICIWPNHVREKDINQMILSGIDPQRIIEENTFENQRATLELQMWVKV